MIEAIKGLGGFVVGLTVGTVLAFLLGLWFVAGLASSSVYYEFCENAVSGERYIQDAEARAQSCGSE